MRNIIQIMGMTFDELFNTTFEFRDCRLETYEKGLVEVKTIVNPSNTNPYGFAHGGYLFTLCDNAAGLLAYSLGYFVMSQQSSISFISSAREDEELLIRAECVHDGRSSKVCEVSVYGEKGKTVVKGLFTLFPVKKVEDEVR